MRILHFLGIGKVPKLPMHEAMGGTERVALEIAKRQVASGHDVIVASMSDKTWHGSWEGVSLRYLKPYRWTPTFYREQAKNLDSHLRLAALAWFGRFDIIHLHEYIRTRLFPSVPTVMHFHNNPLGGYDAVGFTNYASNYWNQVAKSAAQIAVSDFVAGRLRHVHRVAGLNALPEKIVTNQSGVDLSLFSSRNLNSDRMEIRRRLGLQPSDVLFLFAGAIVPAKGGDVLARAFRKLSEEFPNSYLAIAGGSGLWVNPLMDSKTRTPATEEENVRKILDVAINQKRAFLLGLISPNDLPAIYAAADVFILPTTTQEGFGLVILEAFAAGRPVIASRSGGIPELVQHGKNGLIFARGDDQGLYQAMREMLLDEGLRARFGADGRQTALAFPWENTVRRLDSIYAEAIKKSGL